MDRISTEDDPYLSHPSSTQKAPLTMQNAILELNNIPKEE
jgi:hypothetical protein